MEGPPFDSDVWDKRLKEPMIYLFEEKISPELAAKAIAEVIESVPNSKDISDYQFRNLVLTAIYEFKEHLQKLVELMTCISDLPPALDEDGHQIVEFGWRYWDDLPGFSMDMNEEWNCLDLPRHGNPNRSLVIKNFVNVNNFAALATKRSSSRTNKVLSYEWFCLVTMRQCLEVPDEKDLDCYVRAAWVWIQHLGAEIRYWDYVWEKTPEMNPGGGGPLWDGIPGFVVERWNLWRKRFGEIAEQDDLDDETRQCAKKSMDRMLEIDT